MHKWSGTEKWSGKLKTCAKCHTRVPILHSTFTRCLKLFSPKLLLLAVLKLFLRKHLMVCSKSIECQNAINCSLNHYTVKCYDLDLWETTTWSVVSLSQLFQSYRICSLYKSWARYLTKYGHILYFGTLSHLYCLDAFQALHFHHYATEEMLVFFFFNTEN